MSDVKPGMDEAVAVFGVELDVDARLVEPFQLGLWVAERTPSEQAAMLNGWITGRGEPPADVMLRMATVAGELRDDLWVPLPDLTSAVEHLLHALRGIQEGPVSS